MSVGEAWSRVTTSVWWPCGNPGVELRNDWNRETSQLRSKTTTSQKKAPCDVGGYGEGSSIGALLLVTEGVTPLLLNHSRRVRLPYHALHVEPGL